MFAGSHDSDQSISEEDDLNPNNTKRCSISFGDPRENKRRSMQVLSQLEMLKRDAYELDKVTTAVISSPKRETESRIEDDIEFPVLNIHDDSAHCVRMASVIDSEEEITYYGELVSNSTEEVICDKKSLQKASTSTSGSAKPDREGDIWSEANKEVEALVQLNVKRGCSLPIGGQSKVKNKFLFHFPSGKEDFPLVVNVNDIGLSLNGLRQDKELHASANRDKQKLMDKFLQASNQKEVERLENRGLPFRGANNNDFNRQSVVELLDSLQEKSGLLQVNSEVNRLKGRRTLPVLNRRVSTLGDRNVDEDSVLVGGSSSEDEDTAMNPKTVLQDRTMAEQFQNAFAAVSAKILMPDTIFHRHSGIGLFQKLQLLIQSEKEREMDFLKKSQMDANSRDERGCIDVRILSRSLEAKLTVCCCALIGNEEAKFQLVNNFQRLEQIGERVLTIIFSTRACGDVQLQIGNLVRVHAPWKEVAMKEKDEVILLSSYFFQI